MPARAIEQVLREHAGILMSLPGVVATAEGLIHGKPCVKVYVAVKTPELERELPKSIDGFLVVVQEVGEIMAFEASDPP